MSLLETPLGASAFRSVSAYHDRRSPRNVRLSVLIGPRTGLDSRFECDGLALRHVGEFGRYIPRR